MEEDALWWSGGMSIEAAISTELNVHPDIVGSVKVVPNFEGEQQGFYAYLDRLPGVVGQGETRQEAIEDVKKAFVAAAAEYERQGRAIPWTPKLKYEGWLE